MEDGRRPAWGSASPLSIIPPSSATIAIITSTLRPATTRIAKTQLPGSFISFHGFSDDASGWSAVGRANVILDNLIAQKKAKPMLIVMTLGYGVPEVVKPGSAGLSDPVMRDRNYDRFRDALFTEVIPAVQREYRALDRAGA